MARLPFHRNRRKKIITSIVCLHMQMVNIIVYAYTLMLLRIAIKHGSNEVSSDEEADDDDDVLYVENQIERMANRVNNIRHITAQNDINCINELRMDRRCFDELCQLVGGTGRVSATTHCSIEEKVALFLNVLAHHTKNRTLVTTYRRSGETISRNFKEVLHAVLALHSILVAKPEPIGDNCTNDKWKWFKNCLGALDGTHIDVRVPQSDKCRYCNRKGQTTTNVLGVCTPDLQFTYVLPGWEGSAHDIKVLQDAISRRNGLRVPQGCYYLCDTGYANGEGFLTPYRGQRYHRSDWKQGQLPKTPKELFNYRHSQARNVIERAFGLLKMRWAILRSPSWYPVKVQCRIIMACCLLHNFIRKGMSVDPMEADLNDEALLQSDDDMITAMESSPEWTSWRDNLADDMWQQYRACQ